MRTKWIEGCSCQNCGYFLDYSLKKNKLDYLPKFCPNCGENMEVESERMDISKFFIALGKGAAVIQEDITIEKAISIIDPSSDKNIFCNTDAMSFDKTIDKLRDIKARSIVVGYVKKKLEEEKVGNQ